MKKKKKKDDKLKKDDKSKKKSAKVVPTPEKKISIVEDAENAEVESMLESMLEKELNKRPSSGQRSGAKRPGSARAASVVRSVAEAAHGDVPPASLYLHLLQSMASLVAVEAVGRIARGESTLIAELPGIHKAMSKAPPKQIEALVLSIKGNQKQASLLGPAIAAVDIDDVISLTACLQAAPGATFLSLLRDAKAMGAVHRMLQRLSNGARAEVVALIPSPARALMSGACDMPTPAFVAKAAALGASV